MIIGHAGLICMPDDSTSVTACTLQGCCNVCLIEVRVNFGPPQSEEVVNVTKSRILDVHTVRHS